MWFLINHLISPKKFFAFSERVKPWLILLCAVCLIYGLVGGLVLAPEDYLQGDAYRIIYVHVPCAILSLFIYAMMAGAAICGLVWRIQLAFLVMKHSLPIGASFTFLALATGSLWGKPMWGTWWMWDARLTSELILLFLYVGMLLFQSATAHHPASHRALAILVLVGFVDIPIIHYSVYWWNTLHQGSTLKLFAPSSIDSSMLYPLLAMIGAFLAYYTLVLFMRINNDLIKHKANEHWMKRSMKVGN